MRAAALLLVLAASPWAPASAQDPAGQPGETAPAADSPRPWSPPRLTFTLAVGTPGLGDLQTQPVLAERLADDGTTVIGSETLQRALGGDGGYTLAAAATLGLDPAWAVRAGLYRTDTNLGAGYDGDDGSILDDARAAARRRSDDLVVLSGELSLLYRIPSGRPFKPYAALGISGARWSVEGAEGVPGLGEARLDELVLGGLLALGAVVPIRPRLAAHIELTSRFARTPFVPAPAGEVLPAGDSLRLTFDPPAAGPYADAAIELTRGLRFEVGLSLELGRATPLFSRPRAEPAEPGETTPSTGR